MKITSFKRIFALCAIVFAASAAMAAEYVVSSKASGTAKFVYLNRTFTPNVNAFTTIAKAVAAAPAGSTIFVASGTYNENVTLSKGVKLYGNNRNRDGRVGRGAESIITGKLTITASSVTINGFEFTGAGRIVSTSGTTAAPLSNIEISHNVVTGSTVEHNADVGVFHIGKLCGVATANDATNHTTYKNVKFMYNSFTGSSSNMAHFIICAGVFGTTTIVGNRFTDGGWSIRVNQAQGTVNISNNIFKNVGDPTRACGTGKGEFAIALRYIGLANKTRVYIRRNTFTNCQGASETWAMIRTYQGSSTQYVKAVDTKVFFNYNIVKGKSQTRTDENNYIYYQSATTEGDIKLDPRFNLFDNTEYCISNATLPWDNTSSRNFYGSSSGLLRVTSPHVSSVDYATFPDGSQVKDIGLSRPSTSHIGIAQAFDIDEKTGDVYFAHPQGTAAQAAAGIIPLKMWHFYVSSSTGKLTSSSMTLNNSSHGNTFSIYRSNAGAVYMAHGAAPTFVSSINPTRSAFLRYIGGSTANLADTTKTSFSLNGTKYDIRYVNCGTDNYIYPAVDNINRMVAISYNHNNPKKFKIYHLDSIMNNPLGAKPIATISAAKGIGKYESTDATMKYFAAKDQGLATWAHQGFAIAGDYIYLLEGMGTPDASCVEIPGKGKVPTMFLTAINWRNGGTFEYRRPLYDSPIAAHTDNGEPENVRVIRNKSDGRANLCIGFRGGHGDPHPMANIIQYKHKHTKGVGSSYTIPTTTLDTTTVPVPYKTASEQTKTLKIKTVGNSGRVYVQPVGMDAHNFKVTEETSDDFGKTHTFKITFSPDKVKKDYSANLLVTTPGASSLAVPVSGTYTGVTTGVEVLQPDQPVHVEVEGIYDINGRRLPEEQPGINIVRYTDGTARKIIVK